MNNLDFWTLNTAINEILTDYWKISVYWKVLAGRIMVLTPTAKIWQDNTDIVTSAILSNVFEEAEE